MVSPPPDVPEGRASPRPPTPHLTWFQRLRKLLVRNTLAALAATAAEFVLVTGLVSGLGISPPLATALGCVFGGVVNFLINRAWTFESRDAKWPQVWRYALVSGAGAGISSGSMALLLRYTGLDYRLVWCLVHAFTSWGWHLPLQKFFVFKRRESIAPHGGDS